MLFLSKFRVDSSANADFCSIAQELRLDLSPSRNLEYVKNFLQNFSEAVMLTVRKKTQGGAFEGTEQEREIYIEELLTLEPPFFDLEYDMRPEFIHQVIKKYSKTRFILSYHNFQAIPFDLEKIYLRMQEYSVFSYKIAIMVHSAVEALQMLLFAKSHPKASVICMGEEGSFARILGPVVGNLVGYGCLDEDEGVVPGQMKISELVDIYRYPFLNKDTAIYGLIGDPVDKSQGHIYHNAVFRKRDKNAVYVKMRIKPEDLANFIPLAIDMGVCGLSITMPLKEKILPFLDEVSQDAQQIGAVNTLAFRRGKITGINTDGQGALDAIEKKLCVRGKKIVLLGAGGAARAIAFEAKLRGADVVVLNRTVQKAQKLAADLNCGAGGLDEIPEDYDILINCSPESMPIDPQKIRPHSCVMDIVYSPRETIFLKEAALKNCSLIYGEEMFLNQAARQTVFWMNP